MPMEWGNGFGGSTTIFTTLCGFTQGVLYVVIRTA